MPDPSTESGSSQPFWGVGTAGSPQLPSAFHPVLRAWPEYQHTPPSVNVHVQPAFEPQHHNQQATMPNLLNSSRNYVRNSTPEIANLVQQQYTQYTVDYISVHESALLVQQQQHHQPQASMPNPLNSTPNFVRNSTPKYARLVQQHQQHYPPASIRNPQNCHPNCVCNSMPKNALGPAVQHQQQNYQKATIPNTLIPNTPNYVGNLTIKSAHLVQQQYTQYTAGYMPESPLVQQQQHHYPQASILNPLNATPNYVFNSTPESTPGPPVQQQQHRYQQATIPIPLNTARNNVYISTPESPHLVQQQYTQYSARSMPENALLVQPQQHHYPQATLSNPLNSTPKFVSNTTTESAHLVQQQQQRYPLPIQNSHNIPTRNVCTEIILSNHLQTYKELTKNDGVMSSLTATPAIRKRGRPRKHPLPYDLAIQKQMEEEEARRRKMIDISRASSDVVTPDGGHPTPPFQPEEIECQPTIDIHLSSPPRSAKAVSLKEMVNADVQMSTLTATPAIRKRGRPRKNPLPYDVAIQKKKEDEDERRRKMINVSRVISDVVTPAGGHPTPPIQPEEIECQPTIDIHLYSPPSPAKADSLKRPTALDLTPTSTIEEIRSSLPRGTDVSPIILVAKKRREAIISNISITPCSRQATTERNERAIELQGHLLYHGDARCAATFELELYDGITYRETYHTGSNASPHLNTDIDPYAIVVLQASYKCVAENVRTGLPSCSFHFESNDQLVGRRMIFYFNCISDSMLAFMRLLTLDVLGVDRKVRFGRLHETNVPGAVRSLNVNQTIQRHSDAFKSILASKLAALSVESKTVNIDSDTHIDDIDHIDSIDGDENTSSDEEASVTDEYRAEIFNHKASKNDKLTLSGSEATSLEIQKSPKNADCVAANTAEVKSVNSIIQNVSITLPETSTLFPDNTKHDATIPVDSIIEHVYDATKSIDPVYDNVTVLDCQNPNKIEFDTKTTSAVNNKLASDGVESHALIDAAHEPDGTTATILEPNKNTLGTAKSIRKPESQNVATNNDIDLIYDIATVGPNAAKSAVTDDCKVIPKEIDSDNQLTTDKTVKTNKHLITVADISEPEFEVIVNKSNTQKPLQIVKQADLDPSTTEWPNNELNDISMLNAMSLKTVSTDTEKVDTNIPDPKEISIFMQQTETARLESITQTPVKQHKLTSNAAWDQIQKNNKNDDLSKEKTMQSETFASPGICSFDNMEDTINSPHLIMSSIPKFSMDSSSDELIFTSSDISFMEKTENSFHLEKPQVQKMSTESHQLEFNETTEELPIDAVQTEILIDLNEVLPETDSGCSLTSEFIDSNESMSFEKSQFTADVVDCSTNHSMVCNTKTSAKLNQDLTIGESSQKFDMESNVCPSPMVKQVGVNVTDDEELIDFDGTVSIDDGTSDPGTINCSLDHDQLNSDFTQISSYFGNAETEIPAEDTILADISIESADRTNDNDDEMMSIHLNQDNKTTLVSTNSSTKMYEDDRVNEEHVPNTQENHLESVKRQTKMNTNGNRMCIYDSGSTESQYPITDQLQTDNCLQETNNNEVTVSNPTNTIHMTSAIECQSEPENNIWNCINTAMSSYSKSSDIISETICSHDGGSTGPESSISYQLEIDISLQEKNNNEVISSNETNTMHLNCSTEALPHMLPEIDSNNLLCPNVDIANCSENDTILREAIYGEDSESNKPQSSNPDQIEMDISLQEYNNDAVISSNGSNTMPLNNSIGCLSNIPPEIEPNQLFWPNADISHSGGRSNESQSSSSALEIILQENNNNELINSNETNTMRLNISNEEIANFSQNEGIISETICSVSNEPQSFVNYEHKLITQCIARYDDTVDLIEIPAKPQPIELTTDTAENTKNDEMMGPVGMMCTDGEELIDFNQTMTTKVVTSEPMIAPVRIYCNEDEEINDFNEDVTSVEMIERDETDCTEDEELIDLNETLSIENVESDPMIEPVGINCTEDEELMDFNETLSIEDVASDPMIEPVEIHCTKDEEIIHFNETLSIKDGTFDSETINGGLDIVFSNEQQNSQNTQKYQCISVADDSTNKDMVVTSDTQTNKKHDSNFDETSTKFDLNTKFGSSPTIKTVGIICTEDGTSDLGTMNCSVDQVDSNENEQTNTPQTQISKCMFVNDVADDSIEIPAKTQPIEGVVDCSTYHDRVLTTYTMTNLQNDSTIEEVTPMCDSKMRAFLSPRSLISDQLMDIGCKENDNNIVISSNDPNIMLLNCSIKSLPNIQQQPLVLTEQETRTNPNTENDFTAMIPNYDVGKSSDSTQLQTKICINAETTHCADEEVVLHTVIATGERELSSNCMLDEPLTMVSQNTKICSNPESHQNEKENTSAQLDVNVCKLSVNISPEKGLLNVPLQSLETVPLELDTGLKVGNEIVPFNENQSQSSVGIQGDMSMLSRPENECSSFKLITTNDKQGKTVKNVSENQSQSYESSQMEIEISSNPEKERENFGKIADIIAVNEKSTESTSNCMYIGQISPSNQALLDMDFDYDSDSDESMHGTLNDYTEKIDFSQFDDTCSSHASANIMIDLTDDDEMKEKMDEKKNFPEICFIDNSMMYDNDYRDPDVEYSNMQNISSVIVISDSDDDDDDVEFT